jgi:hypothetical protein
MEEIQLFGKNTVWGIGLELSSTGYVNASSTQRKYQILARIYCAGKDRLILF